MNMEFTVNAIFNVEDDAISFVFSASSPEQSVLNKFERILSKKRFSKKLKKYLDDHGEDGEDGDGGYRCFDFFVAGDEDKEDGEGVEGGSDGLDMLGPYGTSEYLMLILVLLVLSILMVIGLYIAYKRRESNKEKMAMNGGSCSRFLLRVQTKRTQALFKTNGQKIMAPVRSKRFDACSHAVGASERR